VNNKWQRKIRNNNTAIIVGPNWCCHETDVKMSLQSPTGGDLKLFLAFRVSGFDITNVIWRVPPCKYIIITHTWAKFTRKVSLNCDSLHYRNSCCKNSVSCTYNPVSRKYSSKLSNKQAFLHLEKSQIFKIQRPTAKCPRTEQTFWKIWANKQKWFIESHDGVKCKLSAAFVLAEYQS